MPRSRAILAILALCCYVFEQATLGNYMLKTSGDYQAPWVPMDV